VLNQSIEKLKKSTMSLDPSAHEGTETDKSLPNMNSPKKKPKKNPVRKVAPRKKGFTKGTKAKPK
jgi:hypothetical protein